MPTSFRPARIVFRAFVFIALLSSAVGTFADSGAGATNNESDKPHVQVAARARQPLPTYSIQVGLDGEIYPVFAHYSSMQSPQDRTWGTVTVKITNHGESVLRERLSVRLRGWSDEEMQTAELNAGETRTYVFAPIFLPRLYNNREILPATVTVTATDLSGRVLYQGTAPARIRSVDDMYWGNNFKYARFIASWVTPHDPAVEEVLSRAKEFMTGRRLPGYEPWKNTAEQQQSTLEQARAIYRALQEKGVSYVKSSITFGSHAAWSERVRMPYESLQSISANCIDGVVMYASLFENLGMDPVVVLVPGHAYVAVRMAENSDRYLYIDTALTGRASFETAVETADQGLKKLAANDVTRILLPDARNAGVYPMPSPDTESGLKAEARARSAAGSQ